MSAGPDAAAEGHYFAPQPRAPRRPHEVTARLRGRTWRFVTDRGVFSARAVDEGTRLLAEVLPVETRDVLLDLGCGYGVLGLVGASLAPQGWAHLVDVNARAVALARENAARNAVENVTVHLGRGVEPVAAVTFDLIVTNPPIRAGRAVVLSLFAGARDRLRAGGRFLFVARTRQGARTLARHGEAMFGNIVEVAKAGGFRVYQCVREP